MAVLTAFAAAAPAGAEVRLRLVPAEPPRPGGGYARARLRVDDADRELRRVVVAAAVRWVAGGPTHVQPITVAPGARQETAILLPAGRLRQTYQVRLLAADRADADVLLERRRVVHWGAEVAAAAGTLVDAEAYRQWRKRNAPPSWPAARRLRMLAMVLVAAVAMAATLLSRRARWRAALFVGALVVGTVAVGWGLRGKLVRERPFDRDGTAAMRPADPGPDLLAVTALRTTIWTRPTADVAPLYPTPEVLATDATVIHPRRGVRAEISAGQVRLFRRE
ncbi:MAG: hypothetical protein KGY99_09150 [Phycisphaerae bacterium]|nr:hypothetical protein [Phycisphaerae bacterium]